METVKESAHLPGDHYLGYAHFAVTVGTKERVDDLITLLKRDCYKVLDGPRMTGDGFYEAAVLDPEGNRLEITE